MSIVVDSPPGRKIASTAARCSGRLTSATSAPSARERLDVLAECALQREDSDLHADLEASGSRSPTPLGELHVERVDLFTAHCLAEPA